MSKWTQVASTGPSGRSGPGLAWEGVTNKVVLFGGLDPNATNLTVNDTWEWTGSSWSQKNPATVPVDRSDAGMAWDSGHGVVVMFGGSSNSTTTGQDTFTWNGSNWTDHVVNAISARQSAAMADEGNGKILLFGGYNGTFPADTWEWNDTGWTQRIVSGPPGREYAGIANEGNGKVILFGGWSVATGFLGDTWEWSNGWTNLNIAGPPAREATMATEASGNILLFGGNNTNSELNDTWEFNSTTHVWSQLSPANVPPKRAWHGMALDPNGKVLMFGGQPGSGFNSDTWEWTGSNWQQLAPAAAPSGRSNFGMAYDSIRKRVVLFGGQDGTATYKGDTWEWNGNNWLSMTPAAQPSGRIDEGMAYSSSYLDSLGQRVGKVVIFGGTPANLEFFDTWEYHGTAPTASSLVRASATVPQGPLHWTATFSEAVTGVDTTDFAFVPGGGLPGTPSFTSVSGGPSTTFTINANSGSGPGTLGLNLKDDDSIIDNWGNPVAGLGTSNPLVTGDVYTIVAPPTISKAFSPASIAVNTNSTLTFTLHNPNTIAVPSTALSGISFSDSLPAGLAVASTPAIANGCGGTFAPAAGATTISFSSGALAVAGTCTVSVTINGSTGGTKNNTTGAIGSTEGGAGTTSNTASLVVVLPPTISQAFNPNPVALNGTTTVTFTIANPNAGAGTTLSGMAFSDTLPAGLSVATTPSVVNGCGGSVTAMGGTISLSGGGTLAGANATCTLKVDLTATQMGTLNNTTGAISSTEGGTGVASNTASLTVQAPDLTIANADSVSHATTLGNSWNWLLTVANGGNIGATFTTGQTILSDPLPATNMSYGTPAPGTFTSITNSGNISCGITGGTLTCTAATGSVTIGANGSFVVTIPSTATAIGTFANPSSGSITVDPSSVIAETNEANNTAGSDSVTVTAPDLTLSKSNNVSGTTTGAWTWTLHLANAGNAAANFTTNQVLVADNLPNANVTYGTALPGNFSAVTGSGSIQCTVVSSDLSCKATAAVSIAAGGSFEVTVTATPTATGAFVNPRAAGTAAADPGNVVVESNETNNAASDTVTVTGADLALTGTGSIDPVVAGNQLTYTITLTNNGPNGAQTVTVTDPTPLNTTFVAASVTSGSGWSVSSPVAGGTGNIVFSKGAVANGETATFQVVVQVPSSTTGTIVDTATAAETPILDSSPGNNSAVVTTNVSTAANLSITKSAPTATVAGAASGFDYTINVTNNGPSDNTGGFKVTDTLPPGTTFQTTGSTAGCTTSAQTVTCIHGTGLISGANAAITVHVTTSPSLADGTTLHNIASVASTGTLDPDSSNDNSTPDAVTSVSARADLSITGTAPASVTAGNGFDYSFTVTNNGPSDNSGGYIVADTLPAGTLFSAAGSTAGCLASSQTVTCTITSGLAANATAPLTIHVTVASATASGTSLANSSTIASSGAVDPDGSNNSSNTTSTSVNTNADLSITKAAASTTVAGDPAGFDYTVTVTNNGPSDNTGGLSVSDTLPAGTTFSTPGTTAGCSAAGQLVTCTAAGLAATGTKVFTIHTTVAGTITAGTVIQNSATVAATGTADGNSGNNTSNTVSTTVQGAADLSVTLTAPASTVAGDPSGYDYTATVSNSGPSANAGGFTVSGTLPALVSFSATGSDPSCHASAQIVTCSDATGLAKSATRAFTVHVLVAPSLTQGSQISWSVSVASNGTADLVPGNNTSATTSTSVTTSANLSIAKTAPPTAKAGTAFDYALTVTNNGPSDQIGGMTVTDNLPAGALYAAAGSSAGCSASGQLVTCATSSGVLVAGSQVFTIHVTLPSSLASGTTLQNTAAVVSNGTSDPNSSDNTSATTSTTVQTDADLAIVATGPSSTTAGASSGLDYTLTVTNNGPSDNAGGFVITDVLPIGTAFSSPGSTGGCSASGQTVTCNSTSGLLNAASRVITIHVLVAQGVANGTVLSNSASVASLGTTDSVSSGNQSGNVTTTVSAVADLTVMKTASASVIAGSTLNYTIAVTNNGPSDAQSVNLSDAVPADAAFVAQSQSNGPAFTLSHTGNSVNDTISTLPSGTTATIVVTTTIAANPSSTSLANTANVSTSTSDNQTANNASTAMTTVYVKPAVSTQPLPQTLCASQSVTFTAAASGSPAPTVQWQVSVNGGTTFTDIAGATSTALTFATSGADDGHLYQAVFTNIAGTATTSAVLLTVRTSPSVTTQPQSQAVCLDGMLQLTSAASGNPAPSIQWQVSTNGGANFSNIAGATSATYSRAVSLADQGSQFRAVFSNVCSVATSNAATLTVNTAPQIQTSPQTQTVCAKQPVSLHVAATGTSLTYQWRKRGRPIANATESQFTLPSPSPADSGTYDVVVSGACASSAVSAPAELSVYPLPTASVSGDGAVCGGTQLTIRADLTGTGPWTLLWSDGLRTNSTLDTSVRTVTPAATTTYTVTSITDAHCNAGLSTGSAVITVEPAQTPLLTAPNLVCANSANNSAIVTGASASSTYNWTITGGTITGGASSDHATFTAGPADMTISVTVASGAGCQVTRTATITAAAALPAPVITGPGSVGAGSALTLLASGNASSYQWFRGGQQLEGATTNTYSVAAAAAIDGGRYTVVASSGTCTSPLSLPLDVVVIDRVPTPDAPIETIVPVIGSTPGANGANFKTSLDLQNPTANVIDGTIDFMVTASGKTAASTPYRLAPGETRYIDDLLADTGLSGLLSANIVARNGGVPIGLAHVYNDAGDAGTTGMIEPFVPESAALGKGDTAVLIAPADPVQTRFNVGVRALSLPLTLHVITRDSSGHDRNSVDRTYPADSLVQVSSADFAGVTLNANDVLVLTIIDGRGVVYGASTDNRTNDPNLQFAARLITLPVPAPGAGTAALQHRIITVAGSTPGALGSHFKTAAQIYNGGDVPMAANLRFHPSGASGQGSDPSSHVDIAPHTVLPVDDLLPSMGVVSGLGSVDLFASGSVAPIAVVRVFNDGGSAGQTSVTEDLIDPAKAIAAGHRGTILAPHDPGKARFNVGVRTLDQGATITATIRSSAGEVKATVQLQYAPTFFLQTDAASQLQGFPFSGDESVTYEVTAGSAVVYGVWTDNKTQDPSLMFAAQ